MRLCRFDDQGTPRAAFYRDETIVPLHRLAESAGVPWPETGSLLPFLPGGEHRAAVQKLAETPAGRLDQLALKTSSIQLLVPHPNPSKLLLLAGNYAKHIEEGGGRSEERARTFPYVFMKPPSTTLTHPGRPIRIPAISPDHIDWELELGVIIGRRAKGVREDQALQYVAGYTVVNDVSDRRFQPNPRRVKRDKDEFFDWLHGKWHDTFCPMGPCVLPADELDDPQNLHLQLRVNFEVEQDGSTAEMVFPVAAVIEFLSSFMTLEPGDIISTGTTSGVGAAKGKFLKPGDIVEAQIERIGVLRNPVE